ncbi:DinB family protein [Chloroflexota bacterium]
MHILAQMHHLARKELERGFQGLSDEDARKRIKPMNCISWIIGHLANQQHVFFIDWPQGKKSDARFHEFGFGSPASEPPLGQILGLWQSSCEEVDVWLNTATEESLQASFPSPNGENGGTLLVRDIFHIWFHTGEIISIRQILGHEPPQYVDMHGWSYGDL